MSEPLAQPWLNFDPAMVLEIAMGADHPHDVAERHGVDVVDFEHMLTLPWFNELVARKRQELADAGQLFQIKAAAMAEALLTRLFQQSMAAAIAAPLQVEVAKQLTDIGRLKPAPGAALPSGPGFQINIVVATPDATTPTLVNVTPNPTSPDLTAAQPAGPAPGAAANSPDLAAAPPSSGPSPTLTLAFPPPPAYISNLKTPDFDIRHPSAPTVATAGAVPGVGSLSPGASALSGTPLAQAAAKASAAVPGLPSTPPKG
jgi:hypothetical protein